MLDYSTMPAALPNSKMARLPSWTHRAEDELGNTPITDEPNNEQLPNVSW